MGVARWRLDVSFRELEIMRWLKRVIAWVDPHPAIMTPGLNEDHIRVLLHFK